MRFLPLALSTAAVVALVCSTPAQAAALPAIQITKVFYDSPGSDLRSNTSLNGEYVVVKNTTRSPIKLKGWTLADKTGYRYTFRPTQVLAAGKSLTIRTGKGTSGTSTVFWARGSYVWNNDKDSAYVRNVSAKLIDSCSYNSTRVDWVSCL